MQLTPPQLTQSPWTSLLSGRLTQLLLLAATMLSYSVLSMAIANSLFVSEVGAKHLPLAFTLIGLFSMPAYILFSQVVDRYSRPQLFRYVLLGTIGIALGLRLLLMQEADNVYYILLILVFFQWDFHNNVLYPSLLTDYFTPLEYKRYAPYVSAAQAVGTLIGGGITAILSHYLRTRDLLLCLPILFGLGVIQLVTLENSQRQVNPTKSEAEAGILDALQTFPDLIKRYPLALFLATSSFLLVIIYISSEFLWFSIYGDHFTDQQLTGFLGLMRMVISVVQVVVIYGATRPLLKILGVAQLNVVYPMMTLASFGGLITHFGLPAAVGLHINGDGLYKAINIPVHQLNYNAIPREFIGRIRTLSDGFIYAIGLTLAGIMLWIGENYLSLIQIAWLLAGLTAVLLLVRLPMGRFYAQGLEEMIRSDSIVLDEFDTSPIPLSPQSVEAVRELLKDGDRYNQLKGLELVTRMEQPNAFLSEITALIPQADRQIYRKAIALFRDAPDLQEHFREQLENSDPTQQAFALEVLLINGYRPSSEQITTWRDAPQQELQVLGAIAQTIQDPEVTPTWPQLLDSATARIIIRVVAFSKSPALIPLIPNVVISQSSPEVIQAGLEALQPLTQREDEAIAKIAQSQLSHEDSLVRIAAYDLLGVTRCPGQLSVISEGFADEDPRVRQRAAKALASYGRSGLALAQTQLSLSDPKVVDTAIIAIGLVKTKSASNILFDYLSPSYQQLIQTRKWLQQIPADLPSWRPLKVAIVDCHDRLIQRVLYVLSALGHSRTVNAVNRLLATSNHQALENAVEVLASLNHRRFVLPLIPLFENRVAAKSTPNRRQPNAQWFRTKGYRLLLEALESKDRWLKIGALIALSGVPSAHINDPDPLVKEVASQIFGALHPATPLVDTAMNRLLLLKNVTLFKNLSLDQLWLIDQSLEQTKVLAGDTIFQEGDWSAHLFIVAEGRVKLVKTIEDTPRELKQVEQGQYFGELALFDDVPRWDSAIALEDCILLKLEKNRFLSLVSQRPHIMLEMCRFLSQRLRETGQHRFAIPSIAQTVASEKLSSEKH